MLAYQSGIVASFLYAGIIGQYMGIASEQDDHMDRRALLTDREREVLRGEADDVENLRQYQSKVRTRVNNRLGRLEEDLQLLADVEPEISSEVYKRICDDRDSRLAQLEREVAELRERVERDQ